MDLGLNYIATCDIHVDKLRDALASTPRLRALRLSRCCIGGWRRARAIAKGIAANTSLIDIDLSYNSLGAASPLSAQARGVGANDRGAGVGDSLSLAVEALCRALRENRTIRRLSLAHNKLGDSGSYAVLESLRGSGSMTALDLRSNDISFIALKRCTRLLCDASARWLPTTLAVDKSKQTGGAPWLFCEPSSPDGSAARAHGDETRREEGPQRRLAALVVDLRRNVSLVGLLQREQGEASAESPELPESPESRVYHDVPPIPAPVRGLPEPSALLAHPSAMQGAAIELSASAIELSTSVMELSAMKTASEHPVTARNPSPGGIERAAGGVSGPLLSLHAAGAHSSRIRLPCGSRRLLTSHSEHVAGASLHSAFGRVASEWPSRHERSEALCPHYMCRQLEITPQMRRILIDWLVELYEELALQPEVLLASVFHVDRFLSAQLVDKEKLQLVGAVGLLFASNHFCKLPPQDGELLPDGRGLSNADDIVYWTDNTYSIHEVLSMEASMLQGLEPGQIESPLHYLGLFAAARQLHEVTASIALELLVVCTREYPLLELHPRMLAACCLYVAVRNSPPGFDTWDDSCSAACGYKAELLRTHIEGKFSFLSGYKLSCRSITSGSRAKDISVVLFV